MRLKYYLRGLGLGILVSTLFLMLSIQLHGGIMTDERVIARAKELGMVIPNDGETDTQAPEGESAQPDDSAQNDAAQDNVQPGNPAQDDAQQNDVAQGDTTQDNAQPDDATSDDAAQNDGSQNGTTQDGDAPSDITQEDAAQGDTAQDNATSEDAGQGDAIQDNAQSDDTASDSAVQNDNPQDDIIFTVADGEVCRTAAEKLLACGLIEDVDAFRKYMSTHDYDGLIREGTYRIPVGADTETIAKIITAQVPEAMVTEDAEADSQ